jgi:hypothetical protein
MWLISPCALQEHFHSRAVDDSDQGLPTPCMKPTSSTVIADAEKPFGFGSKENQACAPAKSAGTKMQVAGL